MLEVVDIHTYYGESYILHGVSLSVKERSVAALLGRNGMGKTTMIRSIIGLTPPRRGQIHFKGENITGIQPYRIARMGIGLIPQGRHIFPSLSVKENLTMAARGEEEAGAWTLDTVYSLFPILRERAKCKGSLLSGGEQQMLTIARALMTNPELLLIDEPSEGLAPIIVQQISQLIGRLKESGLSILLVEQNIPMALNLADYIYVIANGLVVHSSTAEALRDNEEVQARYLGLDV